MKRIIQIHFDMAKVLILGCVTILICLLCAAGLGILVDSQLNKGKYELIDSDKLELYRVKALKDFGNIKAGDIGGYVQGEHKLYDIPCPEPTYFVNCTPYKSYDNVFAAYEQTLEEKWHKDTRTPTWHGNINGH